LHSIGLSSGTGVRSGAGALADTAVGERSTDEAEAAAAGGESSRAHPQRRKRAQAVSGRAVTRRIVHRSQALRAPTWPRPSASRLTVPRDAVTIGE
jgi:hypothetical protein